MEPLDYITLYSELVSTGTEIIKFLHGALGKYSQDIGGFSDFKEWGKDDDSINFKFLDFKICIELKVCAAKELVFIEWYLDKKDFLDSQRQKNLIIKDSIDRNSNIKSSTIKDKQNNNREYDVRYARLYFLETLMTFCEKIDEFEFTRSVDIP